MDDCMHRFGQRLKIALDQSGVSVAELARETGIAKGQLYKLTQGRSSSTNVEDAIKISRFFGQSVEQFLDEPENSDLKKAVDLLAGLDPDERAIVDRVLQGIVASRPPARR